MSFIPSVLNVRLLLFSGFHPPFTVGSLVFVTSTFAFLILINRPSKKKAKTIPDELTKQGKMDAAHKK